MLRVIVAMLIALVPASFACAHKPSDSYLTLQIDGAKIRGRWDIALRDLDYAIGLDADQDGALTWGEVRARQGAIAAYALARLALAAGASDCPAHATEHLIDRHSDGAYAVIRFSSQCAQPVDALSIAYRLFFDLDPQHRGLLQLEHGSTVRSAIFSPQHAQQQFAVRDSSRLGQFLDYTAHGVSHIWNGFDHLLFLLSLLLPAVLVLDRGRWQPAPRFGSALWEVTKVVTAFTLAHSLTLSLAALGLASIPSRLAESVIAVSVMLAALNNIWPAFAAQRWALAFAFGLVHGFGFASVLSDLGLPDGSKLLSLLGFNLGVEIGQLTLVALFLPAAWLLRHGKLYRRGVLTVGSVAITVLAALWFAERAFNLKLLA